MFTLTSITTQPVVCTRGISRTWLQQIGPALVVVDWKPFFRWDLLGRSRFLAALARHLSECFEVAAGWKEACAHDPWRRLCAPSVHTVVVPFFWTGLILYLESYRKERCAKVLLRYYAKGALSGLDVVWRTSYDWSQPGSSSRSQAQESWPDSGMS